MLWMFQRVFFEKSNERTAEFKDLTSIETLAFLPVILLILIMGIYPQPFIAKIEPAAIEQIAFIRPAVQVTNYPVLEKGLVPEQK